MNQLKAEVPSDLSLERLCQGARQALLMRAYSRKTMNRYAFVWQRLMEFAREQTGGQRYSRRLALSFERAYGPRDGEKPKYKERWRRHLVFGMRILDDYARTGGVVRFRAESRGMRIPPAMQKPLRDYERYLRERRYLRSSSLEVYMYAIAIFLDFLRSRGITTLGQMKSEDISAFITSRSRWRPRTVAGVAGSVRLFLKFLAQRDHLPRDFSSTVPTIRVARHSTVPAVWDDALVAQLLENIDRASPMGKRDYAMLLLAARLGLRLGDIRSLRLDELHWATATIEITQGKTGAPLVLPMSEEVGTALIDYLRSARPPSPHREVFLCLKPPYEPFAQSNHLYYNLRQWLQAAGIKFRTKHRRGLHSLRHTLATRLLREQTPFHVISGVLGHASPASTLIYAKADVETLRSAALDTEEVRHVH